MFEWVTKGERLGSVGTSGNAAGKAPHLHYAVLSLVPRPWKATPQTQGWKKMFIVDPGRLLAGN
jgi:murein DD-endopeptidase MepM/ murein hydrolase activator NlpD